MDIERDDGFEMRFLDMGGFLFLGWWFVVGVGVVGDFCFFAGWWTSVGRWEGVFALFVFGHDCLFRSWRWCGGS